jgi:hypothetical protein
VAKWLGGGWPDVVGKACRSSGRARARSVVDAPVDLLHDMGQEDVRETCLGVRKRKERRGGAGVIGACRKSHRSSSETAARR